MDFYERSVVLVDLDAGEGEECHFSSDSESFSRGGFDYLPAPEAEFDPAPLTGDFTKSDYKIKNLPDTLDLLSGLSVNLPFSKVAVTIREIFFDDDVEQREDYLFRGFVYQVESRIGQGRLDLILKDNKYYSDTTAGNPCTEACTNVFGDTVCQKEVITETHTIDAINRNTLTIEGPLADTTDFLFNKGYISFGAQRIDIKYHKSGNDFQMDRPVPSSWLGQTVVISSGCDRSIATCRSIHDNEERFRGLGIAMVDYNPLYESN